jgi:hypothetical protein
MVEMPVWIVGISVTLALFLLGALLALVYGEGSLLRSRNRNLQDDLERAEKKVKALHSELLVMETTVRLLREDLQWERDENRRHRDNCHEA